MIRMNQVTVNGKVIKLPHGKAISVINGVLHVDGKAYTGKPDPNQPCLIKIEWEGPIADLEVRGDNVEVNCGNVDGNVEAEGSVKAKNIQGNVNASGSVTCDSVAQSVQAMGSVQCGTVGGAVSAMGSVQHR